MGEKNSLLRPYQKTAGALLFLAGSITLMGIITAESLIQMKRKFKID